MHSSLRFFRQVSINSYKSSKCSLNNAQNFLLLHLSTSGSGQHLITLDRAWALLRNELDSFDNLGSGLGVKLFSWLTENSGEDWDQLRGETENGGVLMLICGLLAFE